MSFHEGHWQKPKFLEHAKQVNKQNKHKVHTVVSKFWRPQPYLTLVLIYGYYQATIAVSDIEKASVFMKKDLC